MAYRVEVTDRARADLERLYAQIDASASPRARAWFQGLTKAINSLETLPERGTPLPDYSHLRQLLYGARRRVYRIVYVVDHQVVTVLHIRHGAQDAMALPTVDKA